uniref:SprT-like domain-containing protein n=1 Tax=Graphocephala atropunctata TaxID=36148 RepID=A0A1B6LDB8_9HEMI
MFKLESSIKPQSSTTAMNNNNIDLRNSKKNERKLSLSPILKDITMKGVDGKTNEPKKGKESESNKSLNRKETYEGEEYNCKPSKTRTKENNKNNTSKLITLPKSNVIPPTEIIAKFEHISNWLKDAQEKSEISPNERQKKPSGKSRFLLSLSPRIEIKKKIAESTLQEEQKIFEELHGNNLAKRLSDEVDEVISIASSSESVQHSEKVLEKLYGTVWNRNAVLPQSEPRKGRKNSSSLPKKAPFTERKKQRTSIYDVFSSSSSEDRFEEFLESVQRGKLKRTRRRSNRLGTPEFINDSDSDSNSSMGFYHNIVSSAVKDEVKSLRQKDTDSAINPTKVNRRRLSFASSKDDCSESGKSDIQLVDKKTKIPTDDTKKNNRKRRSKKKNEDCVEKISSDIDGFTLVTPLKVRDKKTNNGLSDRIKKTLECEVPKSVGKSKTPKKSSKTDRNPTSEEELRRKYLEGDGFKVPTSLSSLKTPKKQSSTKVPSSPALSFLSSLSEMTAGLPCHPDALAYKKDFKNKREELTRKLFTLYNREVFEDKLPADMLLQWNARMTSTSGYCYNKRIYSNNQIFRSSRIVLSIKILDRADRLRDTLIHELCHAATWIVNATSDGHGPYWRAWADKANRRFPELPVIKRCHDYAIATKFTYKCMTCGYCIGRHSKSLDTDRKRCGFCYGKFQVFVTAKMSTASASAASGSDSVKKPRNPTGFALFVKDNYAAVKKQHNVPHGQVMKLLSQKFAEVKINKQSTDDQA